MKANLILLGAPGSGKGTQAARLVEKYGYKHISTGDLLRAEIAKDSDLGQRLKTILDAGNLVDDATVLELLQANCDLASNSYIFDGFPRNLDQAKALDEKVLKGAKALGIYFDLDLELLVQRIVNRRTAPKSGRIYNLLTSPPKVEGKCDETGEDLVQRPDDNEETVRNRIDVFKTHTAPLVDYYESLGVLRRAKADAAADEVFAQISSHIDEV